MPSHQKLKPPKQAQLMREAFIGLDAWHMPGSLAKSLLKRKIKTNYPVMVLPGVAMGDSSTLPMRRYLSNIGFKTHGWGMGTNRAGIGMKQDMDALAKRWDMDMSRMTKTNAQVPTLMLRFVEHVEQFCKAHDTKVHLVGWSLGGYIAREAARELGGNQVKSLVTMASPVQGGPKYSAFAKVFEFSGMDNDYIAEQIGNRLEIPINCPVTVIYSKQDGIVGWRAAKDPYLENSHPNSKHIEVRTSHSGMGFNAGVWKHVVESLIAADQD